MEPESFDNDTGEGVVAFEPWQTSGPDYEADHSRWYCHLTVAGERIYEYGCPCGTCGILFRKIGQPTRSLNDDEAVSILGSLERVPSASDLRRMARVLEPGVYYPFVIAGLVTLVQPGAPDDYFATDVVRLSGLDPPDYREPSSPRTAYYKLGSDFDLTRSGRLGGPHKALITSVVMPLHDPSALNADRIAYWKAQYEAGVPLTAFAVSVIDNQAPAMWPDDRSYAYEEQFLLANCLLDGHHRIQAAAELRVPIRILSLFTQRYSLVATIDDAMAVLRGYSFAGDDWLR